MPFHCFILICISKLSFFPSFKQKQKQEKQQQSEYFRQTHNCLLCNWIKSKEFVCQASLSIFSSSNHQLPSCADDKFLYVTEISSTSSSHATKYRLWQPQIDPKFSILHHKLPKTNFLILISRICTVVAGCWLQWPTWKRSHKNVTIEPLGGERGVLGRSDARSEDRGAFYVRVHQTFARLRDVPHVVRVRGSTTIFDDRIALIWLVHCFH